MEKTIVKLTNFELSFTDSDIVNPDDATWAGESNPHNAKLFLLHDHGYTVAVVWAVSLEDALDIAVDAAKLDRYAVSENEYADYYEGDIHNGDSPFSFLGNASEPFDIETLEYIVIEPPTLSAVRLLGPEIQAWVYGSGDTPPINIKAVTDDYPTLRRLISIQFSMSVYPQNQPRVVDLFRELDNGSLGWPDNAAELESIAVVIPESCLEIVATGSSDSGETWPYDLIVMIKPEVARVVEFLNSVAEGIRLVDYLKQ